MKLYELWQQAFLYAIRSGNNSALTATGIADAAIREFKERFAVEMVGEGEYDWREKDKP